MAKKRASWERKLYRGAYGSTASTHVDANVVDVQLDVGPEFNEHTDRGDGSALPKMTEQPVKLSIDTFTFSMRYKDGDANMAAFLVASRTGAMVALKVERYTGGDTEFDGDVYLKDSSPGGLEDGQTVEFECHPTDDGGRAWVVA